MNIEYLPHTADIEIRVEANSLGQLFETAMKGMANILKEDFCEVFNQPDCSEKISLHAIDSTCLLIDFLSEVLAISFTEKAVFCRLEFSRIDETDLDAEIFGRRSNGFDEEIKAVTYHGAQVEKTINATWETHVIFDI